MDFVSTSFLFVGTKMSETFAYIKHGRVGPLTWTQLQFSILYEHVLSKVPMAFVAFDRHLHHRLQLCMQDDAMTNCARASMFF
jgi:hypothetical protein